MNIFNFKYTRSSKVSGYEIVCGALKDFCTKLEILGSTLMLITFV